MREPGSRVAFVTLGCKVNRVEAEQVAAELLPCGGALADQPDADVVVVTACAVTMEASHKSRKAVRHALALANRPTVVVTGCLTDSDVEALAALSDRVVVERDKSALAATVRAAAGLEDVFGVVAPRYGEGFRTRALVKIQDGCDNRCAYCIVPFTRGAPRSVPVERVLRDVRSLAAAGVKEVVLTGINVGRYDDGGVDLAGLIARVADTGVPRVRLTSIEPPDLTERFIRVVSATPAFVEHLHVPLQSGCDRTLEAMGRRYSAKEYERAIEAAREAMPGLAVTTDVICGFPGESDDDARQSEEFVERLAFAKLHVFRYSRRPGTAAAGLVGQVSPGIAAERAARMRAIGGASRQRFLEEQAGRDAEVLVESVSGEALHGTARNGARVRVAGVEASVGDLVRARIVGVDGDTLVGAPIEAPRFA
ncbi:MAG: MiaB/RimO family radical SAM methylthiotransferase [Anaerosomatales bacterium]|nr:MiaB/RimO family radical SAM methylthiotransferase [Anaerosomatales bacterium]